MQWYGRASRFAFLVSSCNVIQSLALGQLRWALSVCPFIASVHPSFCPGRSHPLCSLSRWACLRFYDNENNNRLMRLWMIFRPMAAHCPVSLGYWSSPYTVLHNFWVVPLAQDATCHQVTCHLVIWWRRSIRLALQDATEKRQMKWRKPQALLRNTGRPQN